MEALAAIGLVGNIVQFIGFSGKLISKSVQLHHSSNGALQENVDIENAAKHLLQLNRKLKEAAISVDDGALQTLCLCCRESAIDLLEALDKIKVKGKQQQKWESVRKALRSVWSREEVKELEQRLGKIKDDLNFHVVVGLRQVISRRDALPKLTIFDTKGTNLSTETRVLRQPQRSGFSNKDNS